MAYLDDVDKKNQLIKKPVGIFSREKFEKKIPKNGSKFYD